MIIGRVDETRRLKGLLGKEESQFCVLYGRRRVGKTFLVRESFGYEFFFHHTGIYKGKLKRQLAAFRSSLIAAGLEDCPSLSGWDDAFAQLKRLIENGGRGKKVLFIDELPWMDTPKSSLVSELENFWNAWATARVEKDIVLVVCGSATSWITRKLLKNKGGLRGRLTEKMFLSPFTLRECEEYSKAVGLSFARRDVMELYMVLGGIPYYWSFLQKGYSVAQNIDNLFFVDHAQLSDEFEALYHTIFKNPLGYLKVIECLGTRRMGLSREDILSLSKIKDGGTFSTILQELEQCGFIRRFVPFGSGGNGALYQLIDNYTLFYFHCIRKNAFGDAMYWQHTCLSPEYNAWAGLAFERVCSQHIPQIKKALGISGVVSNVCSWRTGKSDEHPGAQIDMLISRGDNVVNLCEMKYTRGEYSITEAYAVELSRKADVFRQVTGTRMSVHLTLISSYGLADNAYSGIIQSQLSFNDLFV
ncbi:MAG: ATP-binding protein [Ruminiclostridium sp.]|nr:ATP-binding protein [Ruminiclostridium sp.]MCF0173782.1 ATP-binding protein [Bacteroidales bacterium]